MAISISFSQQLHSPRDQLLSSSSQPSNCRRLFFKFSPLSPPLGHTSLSSRLHCLSSAVPRKYLQGEDLEEELISTIGEELSSFEIGSTESLHESLQLVDLIQRLGIQRFFEHKIDRILKSAYMQWHDKNGLIDANVTVLGFRLLRLQGYHVQGAGGFTDTEDVYTRVENNNTG
ncbi:terpinolene synthase, chloroplastic-like [Asparagus officinalis]|uniref:terpinolene synthase, chloroplastic-like n=1 Tax=Asparagus officinalis TaxID=4686 RepID=UPI00098E758F|nr:terpinolene synthase, chloroplastic-like [Asparagus officinalis]